MKPAELTLQSLPTPRTRGPDAGPAFRSIEQQRDSAFRGERALLAAILHDAVESYCRTSGSARRRDRTLHRETEEWLFSDDASWCLSFRSICDVLGMDAGSLRQMLLQWKAQGIRLSPAR